MKTLIVSIFLSLFLSPSLFAKEQIKWLIWALNPEFISHGKEMGNGYADKFLKTFMKKLPEYDHQIVWLNTKRWFAISSQRGHCTPHIWKRFKLDEQYYSKAYTLTPPHGILIHKKNKAKFAEIGTMVSLEEILKNDNLVLTVPLFKLKSKKMGSRYPILYPYFEPYLGKKNLQEITTSNNEISPRMLDKERSDYLIAYPTTAEAYSRIEEQENNYIFYTIKEDPYYKAIHVSCDRSDLGKEVIEKINAMITPELHREFLSYHEEWNNKNPQFREKYIKYLINEERDEFLVQ